MRAIPLLLTAAALTGCATQPPPATQMAESQAKLQELTAGKVAGPAISCLPPTARSRNLEVIDDRTFAYVDSSSRVYVNHVRGDAAIWGRASTPWSSGAAAPEHAAAILPTSRTCEPA